MTANELIADKITTNIMITVVMTGEKMIADKKLPMKLLVIK
jgi:hypothetical protein